MRVILNIRLIGLVALALLLGGCQSKIKQYDSTFTSKVSISDKRTANALAAYSLPRDEKLRPRSNRKKPYFVEFRARTALTYGHASVVFGLLDRNGKVPVNGKGILKPEMVEISGLHPASTKAYLWSAGHVVPVPAETGPSDGDFEEEYVAAKYTIPLTRRQFEKVVAVVHKQKKANPFWHGAIASCVTYLNFVAKDLGLTVPRRPHLPAGYVNSLKALNGPNPKI